MEAMNYLRPVIRLGFLSVLLPGIFACTKQLPDEHSDPVLSIPVVSTLAISEIKTTSAVCGGNVTKDGNTPVLSRGVCWSASGTPTISDAHTTDGAGTGTFQSNLVNLAPNTPYSISAYATNNQGISYGASVLFQTLPEGGTPIVITAAPVNVTLTTADLGGRVTSQGATALAERGVCWALTTLPSTDVINGMR